MQRETAKIAAQANVDNAFAISDAIGSLFALCSFLRAIGLKDIAITILKQALVFARKGVPAGRPGEDA